jgi:hypothetical protein
MAPLSTNRIAWTYTDDSGKNWRVAAQKALTDQDVLGGAAAASSVPPKPANIKMRRATGRTTGGVSRTFPLYSGSQTFAVDGAPGTINANVLENSTAFTWGGGIIPEQRPRVSVTTQSS